MKLCWVEIHGVGDVASAGALHCGVWGLKGQNYSISKNVANAILFYRCLPLCYLNLSGYIYIYMYIYSLTKLAEARARRQLIVVRLRRFWFARKSESNRREVLHFSPTTSQLFSILACHGHTSQPFGLLCSTNVTTIGVLTYFCSNMSFSIPHHTTPHHITAFHSCILWDRAWARMPLVYM